MNRTLLFLITLLLSQMIFAQTPSVEQMTFYTQDWQGERYEDGRPKVSDQILAAPEADNPLHNDSRQVESAPEGEVQRIEFALFSFFGSF